MHPADLRELFAVYTKHKILRPATIQSYEDAIRNVERFDCGTTRLETLTVERLLAHRAWCLEQIRPTSYNKHRRHLRALLNFSVAEGFIATQPFIKVGPAPAGAKRPKTVPAGWYKKAMRLMDGATDIKGLNPPPFWQLLLSVMHFTGMRRRQLVELRWEHIEFQRAAILLAADGSKSKREWLVPIPTWVSNSLRGLRSQIEQATGQKAKPTDQAVRAIGGA